MHALIRTLIFIFAWLCGPSWANEFGSYAGVVRAEWLDESDGRNMKLLEDFSYTDPAGTVWVAPAGSIVDGASIPRVAWTLIGSPYVGLYRNASVIHDVACKMQDRPWKLVHRAFYFAMLASGVEPRKARVMFGAVYLGGPRWRSELDAVFESANASSEVESYLVKLERDYGLVPDEVEAAAPVLASEPVEWSSYTLIFEGQSPRTLSEAEFANLERRIESNDLSIEQIEQIPRASLLEADD